MERVVNVRRMAPGVVELAVPGGDWMHMDGGLMPEGSAPAGSLLVWSTAL